MNIAVRSLPSESVRLPATPTEMKATQRRSAFRASIAAQAALLASKNRPPARVMPAAIVPEAMPAETDPPKARAHKHWFWITGLVPNTLTVHIIKHAVAHEFQLKPEELASPRRHKKLVLARQIAQWLCKELLPTRSFPEIARQFGGRDHTTIMHACRVAPVKIARDPDLAARVNRLRAELAEAPDVE